MRGRTLCRVKENLSQFRGRILNILSCFPFPKYVYYFLKKDKRQNTASVTITLNENVSSILEGWNTRKHAERNNAELLQTWSSCPHRSFPSLTSLTLWEMVWIHNEVQHIFSKTPRNWNIQQNNTILPVLGNSDCVLLEKSGRKQTDSWLMLKEKALCANPVGHDFHKCRTLKTPLEVNRSCKCSALLKIKPFGNW